MDPPFVLSIWSAGLALCASVVVWWRVTGPGFAWLGGAVSLAIGIPAVAAGSGPVAAVGVALVAAGALAGRRPVLAGPLLAAGGAALLAAGAGAGGTASALAGTLLLGGVTGEMMLGHWYLVDPTLPRRALRRLAGAGLAGAVADFVTVAVLGAIPWTGGDVVVGLGYIALAAVGALLMIGVWFALGEPGYAGVMAATGLSYLAVLTALGSAVVGRLLIEGPVLG